MRNSTNQGKYRILHLRKYFERDAPLSISYVRGVDNEKFTHIICYLGRDKGRTNILTEHGYETIYLGFDRKSTEHFNLRLLFKLSRLLREKKIDILHCQKHKPTMYGAIAAFLAGRIPVIAHIHGLGRTRTFQRRLANWILLRRVSKIIAVSDSVRQDILQTNWWLNPEKIITVRNCVNIEVIDRQRNNRKEARTKLGISPDDFVFGTVGRLVLTKGQRFLIDAFAQANQRIPNSKLVIIGDGPLARNLQEKAKSLNALEDIVFTGYRRDVLELLMAFDVFVLPSLAEGLSIALLEAMARGLPVIASKVGGIPEVCGKNACSILVSPKNVSALASAMVKIASLDEKERKNLGVNARKRIKDEFSVDLMVGKLTEIYLSTLQGQKT